MRTESARRLAPTTAAQEFCLVATPVFAGLGGPGSRPEARTASTRSNGALESQRQESNTYEAFTVPAGASFLTSRPDGRPRFSAGPDSRGADLVVEPLQLGSDWRLVMARTKSHTLRVNGLRAPRVQVLQVGDQLQIHPDFVLHVTLFRRPRIARAGQERIGVECLLCRTPLEEDALVYACSNCAGVLHRENDTRKSASRDKPLACAEMCKTCPSCQKKVVLKSGYEFVPHSA